MEYPIWIRVDQFDPQPNSGHQPSTLFSTAPVEVLRQASEPAEVWFCEGEDNLAVPQLGYTVRYTAYPKIADLHRKEQKGTSNPLESFGYVGPHR